MYDVSFQKLSERFFKTSSWPPVHMIADLVDGDHVFCLLYKVLKLTHAAVTSSAYLSTLVCAVFAIQLDSTISCVAEPLRLIEYQFG